LFIEPFLPNGLSLLKALTLYYYTVAPIHPSAVANSDAGEPSDYVLHTRAKLNSHSSPSMVWVEIANGCIVPKEFGL
jgi:hypothetical protein